MVEAYKVTGPINCNIDFDTAVLKNKTAIVTGGANGIGEAYVRALYNAGAYVIIGDINEEAGKKLEEELHSRTRSVRCDTTNWNDQVSLFKEALKLSPKGKVDYVVANAGVAPKDDTFSLEADEPIEPSLTTIDINTKGTLYTTKLALHHFVKQNGDSSVTSTTPPTPSRSDTCLILIGSGAGFLDVPRSPEYCCTKFGNRGIMHAMRRVTHHYQSRVNVISPWYVRTKILTREVFDHVQGSGVDFAEAEDAGQCLLRILSDEKVNGHSFFIAPRKWAPRGYVDLGLEEEAESSELLKEMQKMQMASAPPETGLFP